MQSQTVQSCLLVGAQDLLQAVAKAAEDAKAAAIAEGKSEEEAAAVAAEAEAAARAEAEKSAAEAKAPKGPKLVKMVRDEEQFPNGPHEADVHPDEVENFAAGGWVKE